MIQLLAAVLLTTALVAIEPEAVSERKPTVDVYAFGLSYHTDRSYNWNEVNPGLGVGLSIPAGNTEGTSAVFACGAYKDSYHELAKFVQFGVHQKFVEYNGYTFNGMLTGGYFNGSGMREVGFIAAVSVGYDRYELCFTGTPRNRGNENARNKDEGGNTGGAVVAVFLRMKLFEY